MAFSPEHLLYLAIAVVIGIVITLWVLIDHLNQRVKSRAKVQQTESREQTRREIAAYVAEGSISPDDGARLMASGAEGMEGIKHSLQGFIAKGADACRAAGESLRTHGARECCADAPKPQQQPAQHQTA